jgi:hypothetical protein
MFGFGKSSNAPAPTKQRVVNCEVTGKQSSLADTSILTRINGIIAFNNLSNPQIDESTKTIHCYNKPTMTYHSEINVPDDLKGMMGRLFATVDDEDELEQSTAIISAEGKRMHTGQLLVPFLEYVKEYELVGVPNTMFLAVIDNEAKTVAKTCDSWGVEYQSVGRKYRFKNIRKEKKEKQIYGRPGILLPPFNVAIGDCSAANPNGTGYQFLTENDFHNANLACNESAVDYCIKNNCLVYYNDFLNKGALRILSAYTEDINRKLKNSYLFRSSNM